MSCLWKLCFPKSKNVSESLPKVRIQNPLNLDELPNTVVELRAFESALLDIIVSLHYQIEELKRKTAVSIQQGSSDIARQNLGKRIMLSEKKKVMEKRLLNVQAKLKEMQSSSR